MAYQIWILNIEKVKAELKSFGGIEPQGVAKLNLKKPKYENQCNYLIYFLKSQHVKIADVWQVRGLFGYLIRWDYYSPRSPRITQCSRCQNLGHASANCRLQVRCMKCSQSHETINCPQNDPATGRIPEIISNVVFVVVSTHYDIKNVLPVLNDSRTSSKTKCKT